MYLVTITSSDVPEWKAMCALRQGEPLDGAQDQSIDSKFASKAWHCWFLRNREGENMGFVEVSVCTQVEGCNTTPVASIEDMFIKPKFQPLGHDKKVISMLMDWCTARGFREMVSKVQADNHEAQQFYRSAGFEEVDHSLSYRIVVPKRDNSFEMMY